MSDMVKPDSPAKSFAYAREQASQVSAAGYRTRELDNSLVNVGGGCLHSPDHKCFVSCFEMATPLPKTWPIAFRHLHASAGCFGQVPKSFAETSRQSEPGSAV